MAWLDFLRTAAATRLRLEAERFQDLVLIEGLSRAEALDRIVAERPAGGISDLRPMRDELDAFERPTPRTPR